MTIPFLTDAQIDLNYQVPHQDILTLADAPLPPSIRMDRDGKRALLLYRRSYKSIEELSQEEMRLAGLRINPKTNIGSRVNYFYDMKLLDVDTQKESVITGLPESGKFAYASWSEDQDLIAITNTTDAGVELWMIDVVKKSARKLTTASLNANMGSPFYWLKGDKSLLVKMMPKSKESLLDSKTSIPEGPTVSVNDGGKKAQNRTYQDLLKNPTDEQNFDALAESELFTVDLSGNVDQWMKKGIYSSISESPDGNYIMIGRVTRPYSYLVPYRRFPTTYNLYNTDGELVKHFIDIPLVEDLPKGFMSVIKGPRNFSWRADKPATLYWAEALDGGDPAAEVEYRDAVYQQAAPFTEVPKLIAKTKLRYAGMSWCKEDLAIGYEYWWNSRTERTTIIDPSNPMKEPVLLSERNYQDRYSEPGDFVTEMNDYGRRVLVEDNGSLFLMGDGYSKEGKFPFVDRLSLADNSTERIYHSKETERLEDLSSAIDIRKGIVLTRLESASEFPNYYKRNIHTGALSPVTQFGNPFSSIQNVHKEVVTYTREDGLELSATLYLPVGYDKDKKEKMPMIMWAYPREYKDKASASQVTANSNSFTYPYYGSAIYWVNRGYVVLDGAAFPILGEGDEQPNDDFRNQLVSNAKAAIDAIDEMGYIDPERVAVGGHSYGAFMTANLLSHSSLFAAGIARSGAYNRTLTPFGFQSEERNYWEAPEVYYDMSPFMHADKMKTPLLLIHGEADNNSGTYPMQSERYFNALKGLGATVRLVMLPKESHGYRARESIMHMLWEQDQWLEKYVKNKSEMKGEIRP